MYAAPHPPIVSEVQAKCVGRLHRSFPLANEVIAADLGTVRIALIAERIEYLSYPYRYSKFSCLAAKLGPRLLFSSYRIIMCPTSRGV